MFIPVFVWFQQILKLIFIENRDIRLPCFTDSVFIINLLGYRDSNTERQIEE